MPPHYVGFKNFACAWVEGRGTHSVGFGACGIHEGGVAEVIVVGTHAVRKHLGNDGIFESYAFKCHIPVGDALEQIFAPLARCAVVHIELYWLHRLHCLSVQVGCGVARHKTPALHVVAVVHTLLVVAEAEHVGGEVAYARRVEVHLHRLLGEQCNRRAYLHGHIHRFIAFGHFRGQFRFCHHIVLVSLD